MSEVVKVSLFFTDTCFVGSIQHCCRLGQIINFNEAHYAAL